MKGRQKDNAIVKEIYKQYGSTIKEEVVKALKRKKK